MSCGLVPSVMSAEMMSQPVLVLCRDTRLFWAAERSSSSATSRTNFTKAHSNTGHLHCHSQWTFYNVSGRIGLPCLCCAVSPGGSAARRPLGQPRRPRSRPLLPERTCAPAAAGCSGLAAGSTGRAAPPPGSGGTRRPPERLQVWGEAEQPEPSPVGL